ncbi:Trafficking protein particle complex subunit 11 [Coemansia spiralis]|nr:Trafficking protein particle complex subunit 11 [Coemansia spiralis]
MGAEEPAVVAAGAAVTHVFVLDVLTTDVVRVPGTVSPGTLEVLWRRAAGGGAPVLTRMWLPPLELIHKRVQVEAEFSTPVACVGQPLAVCYRVLNPTRRVHSIEAAMHASDSFAYAGTRRTVLNLLPGHVGLLRFNMVPLAAAAPPAADASGDPQYVPGHQLLGLAPAATPAGSQPPTSPAKHSPEVSGTAAEEAEQELPPSNVAGHGWIRLPWLDIRIAQRTARSRSPESARPSQSPPATGLRGLLGAAASAAATTDSLAAPLPPPPTREMSALALGPAAAAQRRTIAALAGLAPGDADGLLTPGLDASDMLPDYFACGVHLAGAESDLEASDDEGADHPPSARLSAPRYEPAEPAETPVLRYDQTAIYCMPMPADC